VRPEMGAEAERAVREWVGRGVGGHAGAWRPRARGTLVGG
jgi:hypothetical protein